MLSIAVLEEPGENISSRVLTSTCCVSGLQAPEIAVPDSDFKGTYIKCDVALITPGYASKHQNPLRPVIDCNILVSPEGIWHKTSAKEIITYGMSRFATLSLSSVAGHSQMVEVRRAITTIDGVLIEQCEYPITIRQSDDSQYNSEAMLAENGVLLAIGAIAPA